MRLLSMLDSVASARQPAGSQHIHVQHPLTDMFQLTTRGLAADAQRLTVQREHGSTLPGRPMLHELV
jgi:hypothetical protein